MYNAEPYIKQCLDSILNQGLSHKSYEIIIVNDGSTDQSCTIIQSYLNKYSNIKLYNQDNKGQSVARNFGIYKASGDYIQFVDADDFLISNSLCQIVNFAQSKTGSDALDMITFGIIGGAADCIEIINNGTGECKWSGTGYDYIASHNYNNGPWYYWLNRSFANRQNLRFEEDKLCEDGMFTLTAILNSKRIANIDSSVYFYAVRPNSTTTSTSPERRKKIVDGFEYAINYFEEIRKLHINMNTKCMERIITRRDSYVFFLLIRLLKMGAYNEAKTITDHLKTKSIYPIKNFLGKDYSGTKLRVLTAIVNCNPIYLTLCKIKSFL